MEDKECWWQRLLLARPRRKNSHSIGRHKTLQWRHNEHDGVSNHRPYDCLFNCFFRRRSTKTQKLRVTGLCEGNSPVTGEFPAQMASNAGNISIWWRHHVDLVLSEYVCLSTRMVKQNANQSVKLSWLLFFTCHMTSLKWSYYWTSQWRHNGDDGVSNH